MNDEFCARLLAYGHRGGSSGHHARARASCLSLHPIMSSPGWRTNGWDLHPLVEDLGTYVPNRFSRPQLSSPTRIPGLSLGQVHPSYSPHTQPNPSSSVVSSHPQNNSSSSPQIQSSTHPLHMRRRPSSACPPTTTGCSHFSLVAILMVSPVFGIVGLVSMLG